MAYRPDTDDPFYGGEKVPSLSWRDLPVNSLFTLEILEEAKQLQSRDFESGELAYWDAEKKRPVMSAVVNVQVKDGPHSKGEERSIWAQIPSNMFSALKEAQKAAGVKFLPGGTLLLKFVGTEPHKNPRFNPIKQYAAKYTPPVQGASQPDPFAEGPAQRPAAPPSAAPAKPATTTKANW
jgi:hypothetical protein